MAKIQVKEVGGVRYKASVKTEPEEFQQSENKAIASVRSKAKIDGFRKGKVPEHVLRAKFAGEITEKSINNLLETVSYQLATESPIEIYKIVNIQNIKPDKGAYTMEIEYDTMPQVKLTKLKGITIKEDTPVISTEDENRELREICKLYAEKKEKEAGGVVEKGDMIRIRYEQWVDGTPSGQPAENVEIWVGEGQLDKEIEEKLLTGDVKAGSEVQIERESEAPPATEGETPVKRKHRIIVTVQDIYSVSLPEVNDELAVKYDEAFPSAKELRSDIRLNLEGRFKRKNMDSQIAEAIEKIVESSEVQFPEGFVDEKMNEYLQSHGQSLDMIPAEQLEEFRTIFEKEQKKRLVNEELISKALDGFRGEKYQNAFFEYLERNFDRKTARAVKELYETVRKEQINRGAGGALENFLQYFHISMLENWFRSQGVVKKNKKVSYSEFMESNS